MFLSQFVYSLQVFVPQWGRGPMGEPRRSKPDLTDGISEGRELTREASSGMYRREGLPAIQLKTSTRSILLHYR